MGTAVALTVAGSDSSGGAGIQADLKSFSALGVYGASAVTLVTVQDTRGVSAVHMVPEAIVAGQIRAVLGDLEVGAIKIGALGTAGIVAAVAEALEGCGLPIVLDPVMIAKSGDALLATEAVEALRSRLLPMATLVTPNLPEAAALLGAAEARDFDDMCGQGMALARLGPAVLMKGGHAKGPASTDVLLRPGRPPHSFPGPRVATRNTHGTGCTLSAAIAAGLAKGRDLETACREAKAWLTAALMAADSLGIGHGHGPVHHFHALWR